MNNIMIREGGDSYETFLVAQGMENAGAEIISIAYNGEHTREGAMIPCSKFVIFARIPEDIKIDAVDNSIDEEIDK